MKVAAALVLTTAFAVTACSGDGMPQFDGTNAKEYWRTNCQNKPFEIQDKEVCRKSLHQWKTDRWK